MSSRSRRVGGVVALVASGVVTGGVLASSVSANAAGGAPSYEQRPHVRDHAQRELLTADALSKVAAALAAKYPGSKVAFAGPGRDGSAYDALVVKADGTRVLVQLDKAFAVTGERPPPARGPRTPLTGDALAKVKAAVAAKYPGATVDGAFAGRGGGYHALVTKKDGTHVLVRLDKDFAVTAEEKPHRPGGPRGFRGGPPEGAPQPG